MFMTARVARRDTSAGSVAYCAAWSNAASTNSPTTAVSGIGVVIAVSLVRRVLVSLHLLSSSRANHEGKGSQGLGTGGATGSVAFNQNERRFTHFDKAEVVIGFLDRGVRWRC
jgi:hypothetical protein